MGSKTLVFCPKPPAFLPRPLALFPEPLAFLLRPLAFLPKPLAFSPGPLALFPKPPAFLPRPPAPFPKPPAPFPKPPAPFETASGFSENAGALVQTARAFDEIASVFQRSARETEPEGWAGQDGFHRSVWRIPQHPTTNSPQKSRRDSQNREKRVRGSLAERPGSGDGEGGASMTQQTPIEPLPTSFFARFICHSWGCRTRSSLAFQRRDMRHHRRLRQ